MQIFQHTFWFPAFDFNIGVAINESRSYMLKSAILKVGVVCDMAMTLTLNALMTELRDLLYNQCIDNTCCYLIFIYPMGRIRVCKIRFVSIGENRGKPCLVCKKLIFNTSKMVCELFCACTCPQHNSPAEWQTSPIQADLKSFHLFGIASLVQHQKLRFVPSIMLKIFSNIPFLSFIPYQ